MATAVDDLAAELHRLDVVLAAAVARQRVEGRWRGEDDLRGVYIGADLASAVLGGRTAAGGPAAEPGLLRRRDSEPGREPVGLLRLCERFGLDAFERFVLLLALAPEVDDRYRTVLGYLHDDAALGAPTVALALELYAGAGPHSAVLRRALRPDAALVRDRLVRLRAPSAGASLMRHVLGVDEWVVAQAIGAPAPALEPAWCRLEAADVPAAPGAGSGDREVPLVVVADDRRAALDGARRHFGGGLLVLDVREAPDAADAVRLAGRSARSEGHAVAVAAGPVRDDPSLAETAGALAQSGVAVAVTARPDEADALPPSWPRQTTAPVRTADRAARWTARLAQAGVPVAAGAAEEVAASHALALDRIDAAVIRLATAPGDPARTSADLRRAARTVARHRLADLAQRVPPGRSWDDLVLPERTVAQLREIAAAIAHRAHVLDDWGFAAKAGGRGLHVLFCGPSGTGKTLAASVIAGEAGYELYAVDLARVVDKYLGETEKHLDRIFDEATAAGAVLLFDEADALFGKRAEVRDARDRYANVEISYLLQRLERHEGLTILATNLAHHLDPAFVRRLHQRVEFAPPDQGLRERLWHSALPPAAARTPDLDVGLLAERFELCGGGIRNAALSAAYLAAAAGRAITLADAVRAVAREIEKGGRPATRAEFRELHEALGAP